MQLKSKDMPSLLENLQDFKFWFLLYHKNPQIVHYTLLYLKNKDYIIQLPQINLVYPETIIEDYVRQTFQ